MIDVENGISGHMPKGKNTSCLYTHQCYFTGKVAEFLHIRIVGQAYAMFLLIDHVAVCQHCHLRPTSIGERSILRFTKGIRGGAFRQTKPAQLLWKRWMN